MTRDRLGSVCGALLALAAARATGWLDVEPLPASPAGFLALAVPLVCLGLLAAALQPRDGRSAPVRVLRWLLAAAPFLVFGAVEASGGSVGTALPGWGAALALAATVVLLAAPPRWRAVGAGLLLALWIGDAVLARGEMPLLPTALNPARTPVARVNVPSAPAEPPPPLRGERPGALVRVPDDAALLADGPGPWWRTAEEGPLPRAGPVVRAFDAAEGEAVEHLPLGGEDVVAETLHVVHQGPKPRHALDLSAYDALVVAPNAFGSDWPEPDDETSVRAAAVANWVRGGGLLIGPPPRTDWPGRVGRYLGTAARAEEAGTASAHALGLGWVLRAENRSRALELLADPSHRRPLRTAFDGLASPPMPPPELAPWSADARRRQGQGALLLAFVLAFALLEPVARHLRAALAALALPALATVAGVLWASPGTPDLAVGAVAFDLGGPGGKRVEAVWFSAGDRGYAGRVAFQGGGGVRWIGPPLAEGGRVLLPPGATAWAVRHTLARGGDPAEVEDRRAGFLKAWIRGDLPAVRARFGRVPALPLKVEGLGAIPAYTLTLR